MPAHTPGRWAVTPNDRSRVSAEATPDRPYSVVVAECPGYQQDREANARLIAAAPDMLDLVRQLTEACERFSEVGTIHLAGGLIPGPIAQAQHGAVAGRALLASLALDTPTLDPRD